MHWKHKAAIQNLMGRLPPTLGNPIYYQLQRRFGGLRRTTPISRLKAGIEVVRRIQRFERSVESAAFLEIGTGHQLALPLSLWLCGASEIMTVDLNPYLEERLVMSDLGHLRRHEEEVRKLFAGIAPRRLFNERFDRLLGGTKNLAELFSLTHIRYRAPADATCLPLAANSFDYHVSFTVLEHIPVAVLRRIFQEGRRLLRPGGLFIHHIDFTDHFAHSDDTISSVNFLRFSESEWDRLAGNRYMFHNRLRVDEFKELLLELNLDILALESKVDPDAVDLLRKGFPLAPRFRNKDWRTNAATDACLVASPGCPVEPQTFCHGQSGERLGSSHSNPAERKCVASPTPSLGRSGSPFRVYAKWLYDFFFSFAGLLMLSPLFLLIATLTKISDGGEVFYRQVRVGLHGRRFRICKFRTMIAAAEQTGTTITKEGDVRITWIGRILRKSKLDELPQLWNVLKGEMSLVGPRPEVPCYVERYTPEQREILHCKPGITDLASLRFRDEEALLSNASSVEEFYVQHCIPRKLKLNQEYAARANLLNDTWIILQTLCPYWAGVLVTYGILLTAAFWLAYGLIHDFAPPAISVLQFWRELAIVLVLQLGCLTWRKQCRGLLSYFSLPELRQIGMALGLAALGLLAFWVAGVGAPPRNVIVLDALLSFSLLSGFRVLLRRWRERSAGQEDAQADPPARVGIIGAGTRGARLALELASKRNLRRLPVAFFDDDSQKWQKNIHEIPVVGMPECLLDGWATKLDEVVIALPGASAERIQEINRLLAKTGLNYYSIATPAALLAGMRPAYPSPTAVYAAHATTT